MRALQIIVSEFLLNLNSRSFQTAQTTNTAL